MEQHELSDTPIVSPSVAEQTQPVAPPTPTSEDAATASRHRFTMTVEDVASRLHTYGIDRDARTIQRWCKSGRVKAILDHANGERWMIDPATLDPVIDDIQKEMSRQPKPFTPTPRRPEPSVADEHFPSRHLHDIPRENFSEHSDSRSDVAPTPEPVATTSATVGDNDATLKKRISDLELENVQLKADKQAREQLNEYMKEQFENMIETALDRTEEIGRLRAENTALMQALPEAQFHTPSIESIQQPERVQTRTVPDPSASHTNAIDNASGWQGVRRV